jgi:hypothetical protein
MENKQQKPDKTIHQSRQRQRHNNNQQKWTDLPVESESTRHPKQQLETQQHPDQQESYTKTGQTLEETILQVNAKGSNFSDALYLINYCSSDVSTTFWRTNTK